MGGLFVGMVPDRGTLVVGIQYRLLFKEAHIPPPRVLGAGTPQGTPAPPPRGGRVFGWVVLQHRPPKRPAPEVFFDVLWITFA